MSVKWMLFQLSWLLALLIGFGILRGRQGRELRMMLKGIAHDIRDVTGKLEAQ